MGRTPSGIIGRWGVQAAYTWMGNQRPKGPKVMIQDIFTTKNRDLTSFLGAVPPISGGFLTIVGRCWEYIPYGRSNPSDSHDFHLWPARMPRYIHWCWLASVSFLKWRSLIGVWIHKVGCKIPHVDMWQNDATWTQKTYIAAIAVAKTANFQAASAVFPFDLHPIVSIRRWRFHESSETSAIAGTIVLAGIKTKSNYNWNRSGCHVRWEMMGVD